jgi:predicted enzyme related to lactoylglutathione lyase
MRDRTEPWPSGTPIWVAMAAEDPVTAMKFYGELFGWDATHQGARDYWVCALDGHDIGGIGPKHPGTEHLPSCWTSYLATEQLERTLDAVTTYGGRVVVEPRDIDQHGRMALAADPRGAIFGLWQAVEHVGTSRQTEPGSLVWSEALTDDFDQAKEFYTAVFGYRAEEIRDFGRRYAALYVDGRPVAGIGELHPELPAGNRPPQWLPYFAAAGADAFVADVRATGGEVISPAFDTDFGRVAILTDPESAPFGIIQLAC